MTTTSAPTPDVQVWDTRTLALRGMIKLPDHSSIAEAFTPDGQFLLVASNRSADNAGNQDAAVWRYRLPELSLVDRRDLRGAPVSAIAVSPDSASIALAQGRRAAILRTAGLIPAGTVGEHPVPLSQVAWSSDGHTLATGTDDDDDVARLWDTTTRTLVAELRADSNQLGEMAFAPDSDILAAGANDWTVTLWHLQPQDAVRRLCATVVSQPVPAGC